MTNYRGMEYSSFTRSNIIQQYYYFVTLLFKIVQGLSSISVVRLIFFSLRVIWKIFKTNNNRNQSKITFIWIIQYQIL